jgi:hypothetical protein
VCVVAAIPEREPWRHTVGNAVEAAYRRATAIEKRRKLMEAWAGFCAGSGVASADVCR